MSRSRQQLQSTTTCVTTAELEGGCRSHFTNVRSNAALGARGKRGPGGLQTPQPLGNGHTHMVMTFCIGLAAFCPTVHKNGRRRFHGYPPPF